MLPIGYNQVIYPGYHSFDHGLKRISHYVMKNDLTRDQMIIVTGVVCIQNTHMKNPLEMDK